MHGLRETLKHAVVARNMPLRYPETEMRNGHEGAPERRRLKLNEQMILWIAALCAFGTVICRLNIPVGADFTLVPDVAIHASTALGAVLLAYGIWKVTVAMQRRQPSLSLGAFLAPLAGIVAWAAPIFLEVAFS